MHFAGSSHTVEATGETLFGHRQQVGGHRLQVGGHCHRYQVEAHQILLPCRLPHSRSHGHLQADVVKVRQPQSMQHLPRSAGFFLFFLFLLFFMQTPFLDSLYLRTLQTLDLIILQTFSFKYIWFISLDLFLDPFSKTIFFQTASFFLGTFFWTDSRPLFFDVYFLPVLPVLLGL